MYNKGVLTCWRHENERHNRICNHMFTTPDDNDCEKAAAFFLCGVASLSCHLVLMCFGKLKVAGPA